MNSRLLYECMLEHLIHMGHRDELNIIFHAVGNVPQIPLVIFGEQYFL